MICIISMLPGLLTAQNTAPSSSPILLKNQSITVNKDDISYLQSLSPHSEAALLLVQFEEHPAPDLQQELQQAGLILKDYCGNKSYIAYVHRFDGKNFNAQHFGLHFAVPFQAAWKIEKSLLDNTGAERSIFVSFYNNVPAAAINTALQKFNFKKVQGAIHDDYHRSIKLPAGELLGLAALACVQYISPAARDTSLNYDSRQISRAGYAVQPVAAGGLGLSGKGIVIGIGDNASGIYHTDTRDRVINFVPQAFNAHGQHVNGTVGSAGIIDRRGQGWAPEAGLVDHFFSQVWYETPQMFPRYHMTITNNSYAAEVGNCTRAGTYDVYSVMIDNILKDYPRVMHIFAAGNDGGRVCDPYPAGFGNVVGAYQSSKNALVVGNIERSLLVRFSSSRGPLKDGRLKPEICALGTGVYSTIDNNLYEPQTGTSMASPSVTGAAGLIAERYKQLHNADIPNDLLKILLMNGARDAGNPGPDYLYGFGIMDIASSLSMLNHNSYMQGSISHNEERTFSIVIPDTSVMTKIMLYWNDTAASPAVAKALVNDLDLEVTAPDGTVILPYILDETPANVGLNATRGKDHLNNVEQVVLHYPAPGNYTVKVKGYDLPYPGQSFYISYIHAGNTIRLTTPDTLSSFLSNTEMWVHWDAGESEHKFSLEFSANNGAGWTLLSDTIAADKRNYLFSTPNITSTTCRFRLRRLNTNETSISPPFIIHDPVIVTPAAAQCPGSIRFQWNSINQATAYQVLRKTGTQMLPADTVLNNSYHIRGLSPDSTYYIAVCPLFNTVPGWRSIALQSQPNTGDCSNISEHGDLALEKVLSPGSGRQYTGSEPGASETLSVSVRNQDNASAADYKISWQVNQQPWQSLRFTGSIAANSTAIVNIPGLDFSATGLYTIRLAIENLEQNDPVKSNDTISYSLRHLKNDAINLDIAWTEGFENTDADSSYTNQLGISPNDHWDIFNSSDTGRVRFYISPGVVIRGSRSASLDAAQNHKGTSNLLMATLNLSNYDTSYDIRLDFDYRWAQATAYPDSNAVYVRGNDNDNWLPLFTYDNTLDDGVVSASPSLSVSQLLRTNNQDFSSSFQLGFKQYDTTLIAAQDYGTGLTVDNIRIYQLRNDVALLSVETPRTSCSFSAAESITIRLLNYSPTVQNNISVYYQVNGQPPVAETVASIAPYDTLEYTFAQTADLSAYGTQQVSAWIHADMDDFYQNDSLLNIALYHQPVISAFPYLEDFEQNDGYWSAKGSRPSWAYGTPSSTKIKDAASGTMAWKTNLAGIYNNNERSVLSSPCIDISTLSNPMLSFSLSLDIEDCGDELCDFLRLEYSTDNEASWHTLGVKDEGTNWYNNSSNNWAQQNFTRWHVASTALPGHNGIIKLRFVFNSDPGLAFEGAAIDDIHIYDYEYPVNHTADKQEVSSSSVSGTWHNYTADNALLAQINAAGNTISVTAYKHDAITDSLSGQYYLPRSFKLSTGSPAAKDIRFYITEEDVVKMVTASSCDNCPAVESAYRLGISHYADPNVHYENGDLADNIQGQFVFYPYSSLRWVPYANGYYARANILPKGEFWFNTGKEAYNTPLAIRGIATKDITLYPNPSDGTSLTLFWYSDTEDDLQIRIHDVGGKLVYKAVFDSKAGNNYRQLELKHLQSGVYACHIRFQAAQIHQKIVINKAD